MSYLVIKALHIVSFTCWMAGLFYLPRLFVYHVESKNIIFITMERKLYYFIMNPAMLLTWFLGLSLLHNNPCFVEKWFIVKCLCVVMLTAYHHILNKYRKELERDTCVKTSKFFRILNEVPTVLLFVIVFCAVLKF